MKKMRLTKPNENKTEIVVVPCRKRSTSTTTIAMTSTMLFMAVSSWISSYSWPLSGSGSGTSTMFVQAWSFRRRSNRLIFPPSPTSRKRVRRERVMEGTDNTGNDSGNGVATGGLELNLDLDLELLNMNTDFIPISAWVNLVSRDDSSSSKTKTTNSLGNVVMSVTQKPRRRFRRNGKFASAATGTVEETRRQRRRRQRRLRQKRRLSRRYGDASDLQNNVQSENNAAATNAAAENIPLLTTTTTVTATNVTATLETILSSETTNVNTESQVVVDKIIKPSKMKSAFSATRNIRKNRDSASAAAAERVVVTNVSELRRAVLDKGIPLQNVDFDIPFLKLKKDEANNSKSSKLKSLQQKPQSQPPSSSQQSPQPYSESESSSTQPPPMQLDHNVLKLIAHRAKTKSKPGNRAPNDLANLALAIEGGGMRGAVSAGMATAIVSLGLMDSFDSIYGSSAGSVIGAYMVSRQMCLDVYTDIITSAKTKFVSKGRLMKWIVASLVDQVLSKTIVAVTSPSSSVKSSSAAQSTSSQSASQSQATLSQSTQSTLSPKFAKNANPGMNISFVLDGIMHPESGLRPLDMDSFRANDKKQPLRIVASAVRNGKMITTCLGSKDMDFFDDVDGRTNSTTNAATSRVDGTRRGLFACLETSMKVPAATGPPSVLLRNKDASQNVTSTCFDAFCYEPIPYRSAVAEGATHVLVLRTRPDKSPISATPGVFEKTIAPLYFDRNRLTQVSQFFKTGGQMYVYVEDYLTLEEGKNAIVMENATDSNHHSKGTLVPPPNPLYGVELDESERELLVENREKSWKRAHLLPVVVPEGNPELSTLSVDRDEVLKAVRQGFAAAFDLLAPAAGIRLGGGIDGAAVAKLVLPDIDAADDVLEKTVWSLGDSIGDDDAVDDGEGDVELETLEMELTNGTNGGIEVQHMKESKRKRIRRWIARKGRFLLLRRKGSLINPGVEETLAQSTLQVGLGQEDIYENDDDDVHLEDLIPIHNIEDLLAHLPGLHLHGGGSSQTHGQQQALLDN